MFIKNNFMLTNKTAKKLYHNYAENMPIIDFHCHLPVKQIAENHRFKNAYDLFLSGDHYKWRVMRSHGVDEKYITGDASDYEKWKAFAKCVPYTIGNPMYHWIHLELKRYFNIDTLLSADTAKSIWDKVNLELLKDDFTVQEIIKKSNVKVICTTDSPYDSLEYHKKLKDFEVKVLPTFRPDLNSDINESIIERIDYFNENGCRLSDHSIDTVDDDTAQKIIFLGKEYAKRGWTMQLHIGAMRNNNTRMFNSIGADTGFDSIGDFSIAKWLSNVLDALEKEDLLPKTILYNLNPKDNYVIGTMLGNFQKAPHKSKIQFGSGWWFNDQRDGMESQLKALANLGLVADFVGMVTDSRSFVSYTRHEYFRRILCNLIGTWVENGEYPDNEMCGEIIKNICYNNANEYFEF